MGSWWCWAVGATNTIRVVTRPSPQSAKPEAEPQGDSREQLPILADMILYYCRFATRPVLLQLYQTEVSKGAQHHLSTGEGVFCPCHQRGAHLGRGCGYGTATLCW